MKQRPILFSSAMVRAVLNGTKTQTRRVVKKSEECHCMDRHNSLQFLGYEEPMATGERVVNGSFTCPYGNVGDRLWVRETFAEVGCIGWPIDKFQYNYRADYPEGRWEGSPDMCFDKWKPSIFMPRAACRILLEITDIRVERLNNISEEDAKEEGVLHHLGNWLDYEAQKYKTTQFVFRCGSAKSSFKTLWDSINGHQSWNYSPWVWVISFKKIDQ